MSETLGLKNVNLLSKEQYSEIAEPSTDELWAISGSGFGFPSGRFVNLELGASGTKYTAPANGWFYLAKSSNGSNQYIKLNCTTRGYSVILFANTSNNELRQMLPVEKGYVVQADYTAAGSTIAFKFFTAEGE